MKKLKHFAIAILCFASLVFAQDSLQTSVSKHPADWAFANGFVSVEAGEIYPFGDLIDAVDNSAYVGLGFRYAYWENVDGIVKFEYSYFEPVPKTKLYGVHQFSGKVGLDFRWTYISPVIFGAGFTCNWTRADVREGKTLNFEKDLGGTLADNETEFGWFARLNLPIWKTENYRVGLNVLWEELWTLPERSDMLNVGVYVERRIW
ncbi:MAG: hypothetical protein MJZ26_08235 [Fibrobacter sp.]|nr:hypothetical protein [Fibrobacter sp.]